MESPRLSLLSSSSPKLVMGYPTLLKNPTTPKFSISTTRPHFLSSHNSKTVSYFKNFHLCLSKSHGPRRTSKNGSEYFASISSSSGQQTASVGVNPQSVSPPPSQIGYALFWVGVGGCVVSNFFMGGYKVKAFKSLTEQMNTQNNQFNPAFSARSPFPFSPPPASQPATSPFRAASQPAVTEKETDILEEREIKEEPKKYAFVDVSPEETSLNTPFSSVEDDTSSSKMQSCEGSKPLKMELLLSRDQVLPRVLNLVEMRNPTTFKWMLQNPQYRQQLEEMLNNMSGSSEWDSRMVDSLKNFDLSSPEVKQQFDQIGLTPEEVISKIMANPDVALAFQNPRVQQAIMECSQNPLSIAKYQNDKEVMDVFNKISEILG
uniref:Protein TIC 40, chloroplastic n=1 Tax=Salix viminalis TaxID=40686 RepID=A0A6N2MCV3_SALVM